MKTEHFKTKSLILTIKLLFLPVGEWLSWIKHASGGLVPLRTENRMNTVRFFDLIFFFFFFFLVQCRIINEKHDIYIATFCAHHFWINTVVLKSLKGDNQCIVTLSPKLLLLG